MSSIRLFTGVKISMETVVELTDVKTRLAEDAGARGLSIRWVAPATYHVTLAFLGWSRPEVIEPLRDSVGEQLAGIASFGFRCRGLGAFPKPSKARVLWAGIDGGEPLADLARRIEDVAETLGYPREKRDFHPHVTLGRLKNVADLSELLVPFAEQSFSETFVGSVTLFESVTKSTGSEYHERASWALEPASKGARRQTGTVDPGLTEEEKDSP